MAWISAVFFCLGAADTLLGDRLGLGSAFRQGFAAVVDLLLLMTGFMALAPWLGTNLAPVITPVFSAVGCDPSLFASLFLFFKALKNSKNHGFSAAVFPFSGLPRALLLTIAAVFPLYGQSYYTPQYFL